MKNKKGAIALSMTTIIVIVIGVTLLILGITFVRGIFGKISGISDETFSKAESMLGELEDVNKFLTVSPNSAEVELKGDDVVKVIIANFEESSITVSASVEAKGEGIECVFGDTGKTTSEEYEIGSGKQKDIALFVKDTGGTLRMTSCEVEVIGAPQGEDNTETIPIRVIKEKKLF